MHRLIFRAFPNHFPQNSVFAHFPFVIPSENKAILDKLGISGKYSWEPPKRQGGLVVIRSYDAIASILENKEAFKVVAWGDHIDFICSPPGTSFGREFCLSGDTNAHGVNRKRIIEALYPSQWQPEIRNFCEATAHTLLMKYSAPTSKMGNTSREVDVVRDVFSLCATHFMASLLSLPLKTEANPLGIYSEQELFGVLTAAFSAIFLDGDVANSFKLREMSRELAQQLGQLIVVDAKVTAGASWLADLVAGVSALISGKGRPGEPEMSQFGAPMIQRMLATGQTVEEAVYSSI